MKLLLLLQLLLLLPLPLTPTLPHLLGQLTQPRSRRFRRCGQRQDRAGPVVCVRGSPFQAGGSLAYWDSRSATATGASVHCLEEVCLDHVVIAPPSWLRYNVT